MSRTKLSEKNIFAITVIGILIKWKCVAYFSSINQRNGFSMEITNVSKLMGFWETFSWNFDIVIFYLPYSNNAQIKK